ncbi:MAG: hypothetical protein ABWY30_05745 [Microterricola sp.]
MAELVTTDAAALARAAGAHLDLVRAPFTLPRSRLLVFAAGAGGRRAAVDAAAPIEGVRVCTAEYERRLDDCEVFREIRVVDAAGAPMPVTDIQPQLIEFGGGVVTLSFAGPAALSIGLRGDGTADDGRADDGHVVVELHGPRGDASAPVRRIPLGGAAASIGLAIAPDRSATVAVAGAAQHREHAAASERLWLDWFANTPRVRPDLQEMTAFCWWVLGANIVELPALGNARAVVPSKIGYVGLWQWDAYFIAVGLRHGDPDLAREQLQLAFRFPSADGQLPDVVHEEGILATSDDLPAADRETLRRAGSSIADPGSPVPLTKPPLAAWALRKVMDATPGDDDWAKALLPTIARSQDWWFAVSDLDGDGMPEYGHPYSSGLDDSPIFDGPLPTTAPDLGAYLVLQDAELARLAEHFGVADAGVADAHRARSAATLAKLLELWDEDAGFFRARAAGEPVGSYAVVSLLPLLTGALPAPVLDRLLAALDDERLFGTPWGVPTVAVDDPDFSPERMWRGPVWININTLLVEGLRASGQPERARELAERTVALVTHGGGPHEYFNPYSGEKAETATTAFGWSAALFIELAVQLSA